MFSRSSDPDRSTAEVRIDLPIDIVAALDGLAIVDESNRKALCTEAVRAYVEKRLTNMAMVMRMAGRSNPSKVD